MKRTPLLFALWGLGCAEPAPAFQCLDSADCDIGFCVSGTCRTTATGHVSTETFDAGLDSEAPRNGPPDEESPPLTPPCLDPVPATRENIVVNEVLVNVPTGPEGDANADGVRDPYDDEFVELANVGPHPVDMTDVRIYNAEKLKFWFEPYCLNPDESIVVFGGGSIGAALPGPATVSEVRFAFGNEGGVVRVTAPSGELARIEYGNSGPESFTRTPQLVGNLWVPHSTLGPAAYSPGTCPDGSSLAGGCAESTAPAGDAGTD